ncbi:MAG: MBL fold metallo-hydrolase [Candidatus Poseidoniales archaeon]|nr:MAG: MBL fold metallo-hydrolase [Candidatus Poseidoniales archaeon]
MRIVRLPGIHHDANATLLIGEESALLIDSGTAWYQLLQEERIRGQLGESISLDKIILTSRRYPFSGGSKALSESFEVPVFIHEAAQMSLQSGDFFTTWANRYDSDMPVVYTEPIDFSETIRLDDSIIELLETPGPSSDNISIHIPSAKTVIAGALLPRADRPLRWDVPTGNLIQAIESLRRIQALGAEKLVPMHGPILQGQEHISSTIEHHCQALEGIAANDGVSPRAWPRAAPTSLWRDPVPSWTRVEKEQTED